MGVRFQVEPTEKVIPTKFKVTQPVSTARIGFENVQVVTDLGPSVLYVPQELTEEQKAQARENIGADRLPIATDDEILEMFVEIDMLPAVADSDGALLSDENGNILLW